MVIANQIVDNEMADNYTFVPMQEVVNSMPVPDTTRQGGTVRVIILKPGVVLGKSWGLTSMHERSSADITMYFMARGLLTDVRRFDRFVLAGPYSNPDGPACYEVADGPRPIGFGRHRAIMIELPPGLETALPPQAEARLDKPIGVKSAEEVYTPFEESAPRTIRYIEPDDKIPW